MDELDRVDPEVGALLARERRRQGSVIQLIPSQTLAAPAILGVQGSILSNLTVEGYPGRRYFTGCGAADRVEDLAIERAKALFGAEHANVQPHSGVNANLAVYLAALSPGDTVLALSLRHGGHLSHGYGPSLPGRVYRFVSYGVDSVSLLELVVGIEEEFGVSVEDDDFDVQHFDTVAALASFVREKGAQ